MGDFLKDYGRLVLGGILLVRGVPAFIALIGWIMRTQGFGAAIYAFIFLFSLLIMLITRMSDY